MHDSLRRNSSLLVISQGINAVGTFSFWVICAHLFRPALIGLATAFISFGTLASTFTNLGLPNTVMRFLPTSKQRGGLFTAALYLVIFISVIGGIAGVLLIKVFVPKLGFVQSSAFLSVMLILFVAGTAVSALLDGMFMAFRKGEYILGKALLINAPKVLLPFLVITFGIEGITGAYVVVLLCGIAYNIIITLHKLLRGSLLQPTLNEIKKHKAFAAGNYFGGMLAVLPSTLVPIIVLSRLGATQAAYLYMPMQIAAFLSVIASSTSQALIAECAQTDDEASHKRHLKNAFTHLYQSLIPILLLLGLGAWPILRVYGDGYAAQGFLPMLLFVGASLFVGINWLGDTWLNVQKHTQAYFVMNAFNALVVVGFVYVFARYGLAGAAGGWLLGQALSAAVYVVVFARNQLFTSILGLVRSKTS